MKYKSIFIYTNLLTISLYMQIDLYIRSIKYICIQNFIKSSQIYISKTLIAMAYTYVFFHFNCCINNKTIVIDY